MSLKKKLAEKGGGWSWFLGSVTPFKPYVVILRLHVLFCNKKKLHCVRQIAISQKFRQSTYSLLLYDFLGNLIFLGFFF